MSLLVLAKTWDNTLRHVAAWRYGAIPRLMESKMETLFNAIAFKGSPLAVMLSEMLVDYQAQVQRLNRAASPYQVLGGHPRAQGPVVPEQYKADLKGVAYGPKFFERLRKLSAHK